MREVGGPPAQLKLRGALATVNTLSSSGAVRSPTHQNAGVTRSGGRNKNGVNSAESVAMCERISSKGKTRPYEGMGEWTGGRGRNTDAQKGAMEQHSLPSTLIA